MPRAGTSSSRSENHNPAFRRRGIRSTTIDSCRALRLVRRTGPVSVGGRRAESGASATLKIRVGQEEPRGGGFRKSCLTRRRRRRGRRLEWRGRGRRATLLPCGRAGSPHRPLRTAGVRRGPGDRPFRPRLVRRQESWRGDAWPDSERWSRLARRMGDVRGGRDVAWRRALGRFRPRGAVVPDDEARDGHREQDDRAEQHDARLPQSSRRSRAGFRDHCRLAARRGLFGARSASARDHFSMWRRARRTLLRQRSKSRCSSGERSAYRSSGSGASATIAPAGRVAVAPKGPLPARSESTTPKDKMSLRRPNPSGGLSGDICGRPEHDWLS